MSMNCIAIDDEPLALELIRNYLQRSQKCHLVQTFTNAVKAKEYLDAVTDIHLIFLDIQMPDITGINLYNSLKIKPMVIFTTAFSEHAVAGFELDAIDYILKPFSYPRFERALTKAEEYLKFQQGKIPGHGDAIFVKSDYKIIRILFSEIVYIESVDDYVKIFRQHEKPVLTLMSMKAILPKLPPAEFARIHRRYIVSTHKITHFATKKIMLETLELPVGEKFADQVKLLWE